MQDVCRCRIVPASALPKVLICTLQTMRHWGRLQWGERRGGVVLFCYSDIYYEESRRQGAAWLTGQGGGWWQFLLLLLSTPCPCSPALHPLYSYCHLVTGHLEPHYLGYSYKVTPDANISLSPSFHIQSGLGRQCRCIEMLNVNVHLKALIERMERQLFR